MSFFWLLQTKLQTEMFHCTILGPKMLSQKGGWAEGSKRGGPAGPTPPTPPSPWSTETACRASGQSQKTLHSQPCEMGENGREPGPLAGSQILKLGSCRRAGGQAGTRKEDSGALRKQPHTQSTGYSFAGSQENRVYVNPPP